jgi:methionyl-tRNA formyltransferase|tara:strand:- start:396 stop:1112 length:717 start_codon:yes stop_codon:yes gene_type:complete
VKKIALLGSRKLSEKILEWIIKQNNCEIVGVVAPSYKTWWNDKLKENAMNWGIDTFDDIQDVIDKKPDVIFSINYWKIISEEHINQMNGKIVNIHHSHLLKYRGRYSTSWAIVNGEKYHGTSLHYITTELDDGPIISSYKCEIKDDDTAESLFTRVEKLAFDMFKENFNNILDDNIDKCLEPSPTYYHYDKDSNKDLEMDYGHPIEDIYNWVRAWSFKDRPKPYFTYKGKRIELTYER